MKILSLSKNERGQVIAEVLNCGKNLKIFSDNLIGLPKAINKACYYTSPDEVRLDLQLNYSDFS